MHYVITVEDSIVYGRHFFPVSSLQSTAFGIIHSFVLHFVVTNDSHTTFSTMLRCMMAMWHIHYIQQPSLVPTGNPHVPDLSTLNGLMDFISVGNILELSIVLDPRFYLCRDPSPLEREEMASARQWYRTIQMDFATKHVISVDGKSISPFMIFQRSLVEFTAAIQVYKEDRENDPKFAKQRTFEGCTAASVGTKMYQFFKSNYPELVPRLQQLIQARFPFLYWTGPSLTIRPRTPADEEPSLRDFDDHPLYEWPDKSHAPGKSAFSVLQQKS
jgi:hypothetical protein